MINNNKAKYYDRRDHLLVFLLIANSGLPFFTNEPYILLGSMLINLLLLNWNELFKNKFLFKTLIFLLVLVIGQSIIIGIFDLRTTITLLFRWIYPFTVLFIVKEKFPRLFVNIMYFLTIVSLILFIPSMLIPGFENFLQGLSTVFEQDSSNSFYSYNSNLLIYTIKPGSAMEGIMIFKRNSGPFWEAGGFGAYLILAILFSLLLDERILTRRNLIFFAALLSTWSTAALITLSALLFLYGTYGLKQRGYRLMLIPLIILGGYFAYSDLPFLKNRIDRSLVYFEQSRQIKYERRDRMVSAIVDLRTFIKSPVFGTGRSSEARFGNKGTSYLEHRNNGITDFLVKYGILFFVFYFWMMGKSIKYFAQFCGVREFKKFAIIAMLCIFLIGFSQVLFQQSVFIAIFWFSGIIKLNSGTYGNRSQIAL